MGSDVADTWFGLCEFCVDNWSSFFLFSRLFGFKRFLNSVI